MCSVFLCVVKMTAIMAKRITNLDYLGKKKTIWDQIMRLTFNNSFIVFFAYFVVCVP